MSEPAPETVPSLIQQRLALQRRQVFALIMLIGWSVLSVSHVVRIAASTPTGDGRDILSWVLLVGSAALAVYGSVAWVQVRRDTRTFERSHGRGAGLQR
ncbi:hypothetical protein [Microbacterium sp. EST19A]|uniref:hypothetical protein n=1 Tax=Microbacterium sp. EST19A TaxID=2862681 RepID=UPI001CBAB62F|nr:hypothetical protein [Microbacterium sp. EST19A]